MYLTKKSRFLEYQFNLFLTFHQSSVVQGYSPKTSKNKKPRIIKKGRPPARLTTKDYCLHLKSNFWPEQWTYLYRIRYSLKPTCYFGLRARLCGRSLHALACNSVSFELGHLSMCWLTRMVTSLIKSLAFFVVLSWWSFHEKTSLPQFHHMF